MGAFIGFSTVETTISRGACARSKLTFAPRNTQQHSQHAPAPGRAAWAAELCATFLTRPSNDKFLAGRHHPKMGVFERVNRFLFDRRMPFLLLVVSHRAPRSR